MIEGAKADNEEVQYLHHGLALRPFVRRFELADHVSVVGAKLENGLLIIDLKKETPEEMKPRRIAVDAEPGERPASKRIEGNVAA
jgi:molecular chaperone IbpA